MKPDLGSKASIAQKVPFLLYWSFFVCDGNSQQTSAAMGELPLPTPTPLEALFFFFQKVSPPNPWPGLHDKLGTNSKICEVVNVQWVFYNPVSWSKGRPCLNKVSGSPTALAGAGGCVTCTWMCQHQPGILSVWVFTRSLCIGQLFTADPQGSERALWEHFFPVNESDSDETPHTLKMMTIYILNMYMA